MESLVIRTKRKFQRRRHLMPPDQISALRESYGPDVCGTCGRWHIKCSAMVRIPACPPSPTRHQSASGQAKSVSVSVCRCAPPSSH